MSPDPSVPSVPPLDRTQALKAWRRGLGSVDPRQPLSGYSTQAWFRLCDDAAWLFDTFGEGAARDGWSSADMFGLWPDKQRWGGLADRLSGSRSLVMSADRANWRSVVGNIGEGFNRGAYPDLKPFWKDLR